MTLTPLSRSKDQRSTCRGRGHIVAASRTVIGVVTMSSTHTHFSYLFKYWRSAVNPQLQAALTFCMLGWPRAVVAGIGHILYEAYWPRPHFWRNGRAADESLAIPWRRSCLDPAQMKLSPDTWWWWAAWRLGASWEQVSYVQLRAITCRSIAQLPTSRRAHND